MLSDQISPIENKYASEFPYIKKRDLYHIFCILYLRHLLFFLAANEYQSKRNE